MKIEINKTKLLSTLIPLVISMLSLLRQAQVTKLN